MNSSQWKMPADIHAEMSKLGESDYPDETCGFVFEKDGIFEIVPMENIQNKLHAADPEKHLRDAGIAYQFDASEMQRVLDAREGSGSTLRAIYHSHPDTESYFSETDSAAAAVWGTPNYPGVIYLVYSVKKGQTMDCKAFDWSDGTKGFVEIPIEIEL